MRCRINEPGRDARMKNSELCVREVQVAPPEASVRSAAQRMGESEVGSLVVVDALRRPLGIVTDRDLVVRCIAPGRDPERTRLRNVMSGPPAWVRENGAAEEAIDEMARLKVRRLPVVDDHDRLVGILALDDIVLAELAPESLAIHALRANL
jgi:CBS domain-containing protein